MAQDKEPLIQECKRQAENGLYTSTALFIWLKYLRAAKLFFTIVPLLLGSLAGWNLIASSEVETIKLFAAASAFLAGLLPTVYSAIKLDDQIVLCAQLASEFKNLQDRFRQAALISAQKEFADFESDFNTLMTQMSQARSHSYTAPEWIFKKAQKKVKSGDYDFDVDEANE